MLRQRYDAGALVFRQGDAADVAYIIESGCLYRDSAVVGCGQVKFESAKLRDWSRFDCSIKFYFCTAN